MRKNINAIIRWGAVWGLVEATLGYILHSIPLSVGWFFWFPLAFYFMHKVYKQTNSLSSMFFTSAIAASIKLINFLLPTRIDRVVNPVVSILLEGLTVFAVYKLIENRKSFFRLRYIEALTVSVGWRVLYIIYILLMPRFFFDLSPLRAVNPLLKFLVLESITNSLIIYAYIKITERADRGVGEEEAVSWNKLKQLGDLVDMNAVLGTSFSFLMLALAVFVQWAL